MILERTTGSPGMLTRVPRQLRRFTPRLRPHKPLPSLKDNVTTATVVVVLLWAVVTRAHSLDTAACLHQTTLATRSAWTISVVCKPVVRNVKPALVLVLNSAPARYLAARAAVVVARVLVLLEMVKVLDLHQDRVPLHSKRRRRRRTSTPSGKRYSSFCLMFGSRLITFLVHLPPLRTRRTKVPMMWHHHLPTLARRPSPRLPLPLMRPPQQTHEIKV